MIAICERTSIEITLENATNYAVYALLRLFSIIDMNTVIKIDYTKANTFLKGTATLMITMFYMKDHNKP